MDLQSLFWAICVAVVVAVAKAISWALRRLGAKPSFIACVLIAVCLLSMVATNVAMLLAARRARLEGGEKAAEAIEPPLNSRANR
jgi:hypothetical protein